MSTYIVFLQSEQHVVVVNNIKRCVHPKGRTGLITALQSLSAACRQTDADENGNEMEGFCHNSAVGRLLVNHDLLRMVLTHTHTHTNVQFHWCVYDGEESEVMSFLSVMVSHAHDLLKHCACVR